MTLLQQFADSVTGSTLPVQFRNIRMRLTLIVVLFLSLLLILSGVNVTETTRIGLQDYRDQLEQQQDLSSDMSIEGNTSQTPPNNTTSSEQNAQNNTKKPVANPSRQQSGITNPTRIREEIRRNKFFRNIQRTILVNNILLLVILSFLTWISLYFLLKPLADAVAEREKFITFASHELRTPLAILYSEMSLSQDATSLKELKNVHKESLVEIKRLQNLSEVLLSNEIGNGSTMETENLDVKSIISEVIESLSGINTNNLKFLIDLIDENIFVVTEKTRLYQLFYNILENATKYSLPHSDVIATIDSNQNLVTVGNITDIQSFTPSVGVEVCKELASQIGVGIRFEQEGNTFTVILDIGSIAL